MKRQKISHQNHGTKCSKPSTSRAWSTDDDGDNEDSKNKERPSKKHLCVDQIDREEFEKDRKRIKERIENSDEPIIEIKPFGHFENVRTAYEYLRNLCQQSPLVQQRSLLPVVWRHQLYSFFPSRTKVDVDLELMIDRNYVRILSHGESSHENDAIVLMDDFVQYYKKQKNLFLDLFISRMVKKFKETEYDVIMLQENGFGPDALKKLTSFGLLTSTDLDHRQLSFAGLGILVNNLNQGRHSLLRIIRRCKYSQLLQSELIHRSDKAALLKKHCQPLGLEFHLYDLYGRQGLVERRSANIKHDCLVQLVLK